MRYGVCRTNGYGASAFNIPTDNEGNNVLTGDGKQESDEEKTFFCTELEVYLIIN